MTERHKQICKLLVKGYTLKEVSEKLGITYKTLRTHMTAIYRLNGIDNNNTRKLFVLMVKLRG